MPSYNASAVSYSSYPRSYYDQRSQYLSQTGQNLSYEAWRAFGSPTGTRTTPSSTYTGNVYANTGEYPSSHSASTSGNRAPVTPSVSSQANYQGGFLIGNIGGADSIISTNESSTITGYATPYSGVVIYAHPDRASASGATGLMRLGSTTADQNGRWNLDASSLKSLYALGTKFTISASAWTSNNSPVGGGTSNPFSFEIPTTLNPVARNTTQPAILPQPQETRTISSTNLPTAASISRIGGADSVINKDESTLVNGKASPNALVNINIHLREWKPGDGVISVGTYAKADQSGNWSFDLSSYKDKWTRGSTIGFAATDSQNQNAIGSQNFSFAPDPITGTALSNARPALVATDLVTGRMVIAGASGSTKWSESLVGSSTNEFFDGNGGQDQLYGGGGADVFDLRDYRGGSQGQSTGTNYATIRDFSADDRLILGSSVSRIDQMSNGWSRIWEGSQLSGVVMGEAAATLSLTSSQVHIM